MKTELTVPWPIDTKVRVNPGRGLEYTLQDEIGWVAGYRWPRADPRRSPLIIVQFYDEHLVEEWFEVEYSESDLEIVYA